jgi:hypothetical protein
MKKLYEELEINVLSFDEEDILTTSPGGGFDNVFSDEKDNWNSVEF